MHAVGTVLPRGDWSYMDESSPSLNTAVASDAPRASVVPAIATEAAGASVAPTAPMGGLAVLHV